MTGRYEYRLVVECSDAEGCVARINGLEGDDAESPLRGYGETPILALRALVETLADWPAGGADRWLNTPRGTQLARMFVPGFEPKRRQDGAA